MSYLTMFDAVTVDNIPSSARYVALYVDGGFANVGSGKLHCPHADVLTITVTGSNPADCCDCEAGNMTPAQAEAWVAQRLAAGVYRPCVYASADTWMNQGLATALLKYGPKIRRWVAAYPGTGANVPPGYDAHQYSDGGGKLDTSVCLPDFFDLAPPHPHGTAHLLLSLNLATGQWVHRPIPGLVHWGSEEKWASVEAQVCVGGPNRGAWRLAPLPWNAPPLGG